MYIDLSPNLKLPLPEPLQTGRRHVLYPLYTPGTVKWHRGDTRAAKENIKGSQLGAFCSQTIVYGYPEFKLRYLKNLKLFSIRVKELFEPTDLRREADGIFALFKSIFLRLGRNEIWCAEDNHSYMCHMAYFLRNCPKFYIFTKIVFPKHNWNFLDQLLLSYKFYGRDILLFFSIFFPVVSR